MTSVPVTVYVVVTVGLTLMLAPASPVLHTKLAAPVAVNVADAPRLICNDDPEILTTGIGLTNTVRDADEAHPATFVPVTV